jgi:L-alanine-DL-glutamate epimerase-like enolase superfamily enzyme
MKVGGAPLPEDVRRVAAVREPVGPEIRLMVDAVYNLGVPEALRLARAFAPSDIYRLEASVSPSLPTASERRP